MSEIELKETNLPIKPSENNADQLNGAPRENSSGLILPEQILPPHLLILPVNGTVIFPTLMAPIVLNEKIDIQTAEEALANNKMLGLLLTKNAQPIREQNQSLPQGMTQNIPEHFNDEMYSVGVAVKIIKKLKLPDGSISILIHSTKRFRVKKFISQTPVILSEVEYLDDEIEKSNEMDALVRTIVSHVKRLSETNPFFTEEMRLAMINAPGPGTVADLVAFALALSRENAQEILETLSVRKRFERILIHLRHEQNLADIQKKITDDVNTKVSKLQREYFLKEQLKSIKKELGIEEDGKEKTSRTFKERIEMAGMPEDAKKQALEELNKFETLSEQSPEYNIVRNYLETLVSLPWSTETNDLLDLKYAKTILDEDHFGLEKVKERILEFLAVRKLKDDPKGSIICLVGPPGVGKTSIGKSIARTMGRKFYRFSLGGMRDEAEIKGHRRTYIGAMPGKVIQGIRRAGSKNTVMMLDEIDKLGMSFQGDPASALLEVLDPEQNSSFLDHYLDIPFDLSKVLFIATANNLSTIPAPLLDRMEIIELPGYTLEEKEEIAQKYVIPRAIEETGLNPNQISFEKAAIKRIMQDYAREPGLRVLQQLAQRICRKAAAQIVEAKSLKLPLKVEAKNLVKWLGPQRFYNEANERISAPGIGVGLAWTAMGGDILFIEATDIPGKGQLKLTGQMGDVMTESASIAWSYIQRKLWKENPRIKKQLDQSDIHLHLPAGAIPKDGPSAGITMATVLYSLFTQRLFKQRLAMTGELSLVGKVLPIGGIKEKLLAAKRVGISEIILPKLNQKDMEDIPSYVTKNLKIHWVSHVEEVFELALEKQKTKRGGSK